MFCRYCDVKTLVVDVKEYSGRLYRKRRCPKCGSTFYTEEECCERTRYRLARNKYDKNRREDWTKW